ncbi:uncharacterized protein LOC135071112 [Ostrinia nubilalis]|uniref:uncharacterized protein LOC114355186 n=1 Tax=Ostrinia furnacalis TaxID=93504 RepID=UPI00103C8140|nr:uncharacterized protein LOC114355186 [Ostrinia furnacalis]
MKSVAIAFLALALLNFSTAEDDGQYHPGKYGTDDGSYKPTNEGRYYGAKDRTYKYYSTVDNRYFDSVITPNGKYDSIYSAYQPVIVKAQTPYQQILTPFVNYEAESGFEQYPFGSSLSAVTYRPPVVPVVSTISPVVSSVAPVVSTVSPIAYASTPRPVVYSAPVKPFVYSATPKPIVYSAAPKSVVIAPKAVPVSVPVYAKAHPYSNEAYARIIKQDTDVDANSYRYLYETENGIAAQEVGVVDAVNGGGTRASGFYEYVGDDGLKYRVDYTADENGFHPRGAHLP